MFLKRYYLSKQKGFSGGFLQPQLLSLFPNQKRKFVDLLRSGFPGMDSLHFVFGINIVFSPDQVFYVYPERFGNVASCFCVRDTIVMYPAP